MQRSNFQHAPHDKSVDLIVLCGRQHIDSAEEADADDAIAVTAVRTVH